MDIFKIVRKNNLELFKDAITKDDDLLYQKDSYGSNLLHKAIFWKCNEIVNYLKDNEKLRDEVDDDGYTVYHKAVLNHNYDAIVLLGKSDLLTVRNNTNDMSVTLAAKMGNRVILEILFEILGVSDLSIDMFSDKSNPFIVYNLSKKIPIEEPISLYPRDDLIDPYSLEDIKPGDLYAIRKDSRDNYYCMGTVATIDTMIKNKYKSNSDTMVFDMVQNQTVPTDSILFTVKKDCPNGIKKLFNKSFSQEDIDLQFTANNYYDKSQLFFAEQYKNENAIKLIKEAMKKD